MEPALAADNNNYAEAPPPFTAPPQYVQILPPLPQGYLNEVDAGFQISFKSNEKHIKHPNQVVSDDTLHCVSKKPVCVYLGNYIRPFGGVFPHIYAYLKFHSDKKRSSLVSICEKHNPHASSQEKYKSVICSDSVGVAPVYCPTRQAFTVDFIYPASQERPSISIAFACNSSCFSRNLFELHVDLLLPDGNVLSRKHLVKVSANPGRDCHTPASLATQFAHQKGAFEIAPKPRARKLTNSDSEPSPKRPVPEAPEDDEPELPDNRIFTLTIFGLKDYKAVLKQYNMLITQDKYRQMKQCAAHAPILNSQIPADAELDGMLEKAHVKKHKNLLNANGINNMMDLHKVYHRHYFEDLGIPADEARILHASFIYWRTSYLAKVFKVEAMTD